jgi:para-nitrobenzyl esterase
MPMSSRNRVLGRKVSMMTAPWHIVLRPALLGLVVFATACRAPLTAAAESGTGSATLVQLDAGKVRGTAVNEVIAFKGIPFAQPPVGALRWRAPQPIEAWEGVLDASAFSSDCAQLPLEGTSEDCLYINVWRPAAADEPLPVMVWTYGGALVRGAASLYPGQFLAQQGIIVVSFNYRLGRFGFFAHPALAREAPDEPRGNYGYLDQIAALQWVRHNIAAFGGDPQNVTLAGESAGGGSVLVQITSPLARGLFQRAIVQSAGIPTARASALPLRELAVAESMAVEYAHAAGIEGDTAATLVALRALPIATLAEGTEVGAVIASAFGGPPILGLAGSILDGRLLVEAPEATLRRGQNLVPVITGANDSDLAGSPAQTKEELFTQLGLFAAQARTLYDPKGDASLPDLIQSVVRDRDMLEPSRHLAELTAQSGQPAYYYRFSYVAQSQREQQPGALHGSEIQYAFDAVEATLKGAATAADVALARTMSGYWSAFVRTGDPNGSARPEWPRYDPATQKVFNFTNPGVMAGDDPRREALDAWRAFREQGVGVRASAPNGARP